MTRLPVSGSDSGAWGDILNDYLLQAHEADGSIRAGTIVDSQIAAGASVGKTKLAASVQTSLDKADAAAPTLVGGKGVVRKDELVLNVKDYGAVADGTTDDGPAIQATINALGGSGTVFIPAGTYRIATTISCTTSDVTIHGVGRGTTLVATSAPSAGHIINVVGSLGSEISGVTVRDLRVIGYGDNAGVTLHHGIRFKYVDRGSIRNIWGRDITFVVAFLEDCRWCIVDGVVVEAGSLGSNGGWYGVSANNIARGAAGSYAAHHTISNVVAALAEHSLSLYLVDNVTVSNIVTSGNINDYAINITGSRNITLTGCTTYSAGGGYLFLERDTTLGTNRRCDRVVVQGFVGQGAASSQLGALITDSPRTVLSGLDFDNSTQASGHGIKIDLNSGESIVENCILVGNSAMTYGIYVENGANGTIIRSNIITSVGSVGINIGQLNGGLIAFNRADSCGSHGIQFATRRAPIIGNVCRSNTGSGIVSNFGDDSMIGYNTCELNVRYGVEILASTSDRNRVTNNQLGSSTVGNANTLGPLLDSGTGTVIGDNAGYVTENKGTATIASTTTSIVVTHGLSFTPSEQNIILTPSVNPGGHLYVDTFTATQFTIRISAAPAGNVPVGWRASRV